LALEYGLVCFLFAGCYISFGHGFGPSCSLEIYLDIQGNADGDFGKG